MMTNRMIAGDGLGRIGWPSPSSRSRGLRDSDSSAEALRLKVSSARLQRPGRRRRAPLRSYRGGLLLPRPIQNPRSRSLVDRRSTKSKYRPSQHLPSNQDTPRHRSTATSARSISSHRGGSDRVKSCPQGRPHQLLTLLMSILDLDEIT